MLTWIISVVIAVAVIVSGVLYAIFAPGHRVCSQKNKADKTVCVNNKGISMDKRDVYSIPYEDCNL